MATIHDIIPWRDREEEANMRTLSRLQRDIDTIFDEFFRGGAGAPLSRVFEKTPMLAPRMDIAETEKGYHLMVELPGVSEKDVEVSLLDGVLHIHGEKKAEEKKEGKHWHRVERSFGAFQRSITLPKGIDEDTVSARYRHGILEIEVLKSEKKKDKSRKIDIKSA